MESRSKPEDKAYVERQIRFSIILWICSAVSWYFLVPSHSLDLESPWKRIIYALRWQIFALLPVLFLIRQIANTRLNSKAIDPVNGGGEHLVGIYQRILVNTTEQFILHFIGVMVLSSYLTTETMKFIPFFVIMFLIGRILFYIGYTSSSPLNRAVGMAFNFVGNFVLIVSSIICFLLNGHLYQL